MSQFDLDFLFKSHINYLENWSSFVAYKSIGYRFDLAKHTSHLDVVRHYGQVTTHELQIGMFTAGAFLQFVCTSTVHVKFGMCSCSDLPDMFVCMVCV